MNTKLIGDAIRKKNDKELLMLARSTNGTIAEIAVKVLAHRRGANQILKPALIDPATQAALDEIAAVSDNRKA